MTLENVQNVPETGRDVDARNLTSHISETPAAPLHGHSTGRALGCHRQWPRSVVMSNGWAGNDES